tara:strand:- start:173 stop:589 length:417 start_codon:yes stop_codon:yes gene_type:complete
MGVRRGPLWIGNLVNAYSIAMIGTAMVIIQCPNCGEDVELEDGAFGLFDCPYCDEDFSYLETDEYAYSLLSQVQFFLSPGMIVGLIFFGIGLIWFILLKQTTSGGGLGNLVLIYPAGVCGLGIPIILISFILKLRQLN